MALDRSFKPDPELKGSYYRRLEDIPLAEKLAKAIVGIDLNPTSARCIPSTHGCQIAGNQIIRTQDEAHDFGSRTRCPVRASIAPPAAVERDHDPQSPVARFRADAR